MVGTAPVTSQGLGFGVLSPPIRPFSGHGRLLIPHHLLAFAQCGRKLGFPGWAVPTIFLPPSPSPFFFFLSFFLVPVRKFAADNPKSLSP